ncbi:polya polymerase [Candidatus Galacturonibacter soehngenii]|uniref:Polya polymerase n=1 Tax=Candidatus Galacturonatibacter soehngenii TaxID=2307010 RepID=A0A7V7UCH7_9FIRM|nr:polya polymerase [Candidatus Galacturonibacter soehngenii]KAB1438679.1 polya polymerase [Candidatus Galacturonibacter soehngenii]MBA4685719.1 polya polymerase [Candidatus Galacturonibacter soehngenii]
MYLKRDIDIKNFLLQVTKCAEDVFFETTEGDVLNLSSTLSQYVFCSISIQPEYWVTGTIRCANASDYKILSDYLLEV